MEKYAQSVVVEIREAAAGSLDLLGAVVRSLGWSVRRAGVVMVQDLASPARKGVAQCSDLGHLVSPTRPHGVVEQYSRFIRIIDEIDAAH